MKKIHPSNSAATSANASASGGIGFVGLLTILFIGLKLANIIEWSWWWALSPIWISGLAVCAVLLVVLIIVWAKS
jgi:fatty acid desaturase